MIGCKARPAKTVYIKECQELIFDLTDGTLNGVKPDQKQTDIKEWLPCYTQFIPDGSTSVCGGAILYANHDFYFYTYFDDYIEVRANFKGTVSGNLLGKSRDDARQFLNNLTFVENKEQDSVDFFTTEYGCIRIHYNENKVVKIAAHYTEFENLNWCKD
jgi:hypothetical protein